MRRQHDRNTVTAVLANAARGGSIGDARGHCPREHSGRRRCRSLLLPEQQRLVACCGQPGELQEQRDAAGLEPDWTPGSSRVRRGFRGRRVFGAQGPQGPQGPSGANIGSDFYASYNSHRIDEDDSNSHQKDVEIVGVSDVAAGTYLINGTVKIQFDSCTFCVGDPIVQCYFEDQAGEFFDGYTVTGNLSGHDDQAVYSLTTVRTFPNPPNTIGVVCGTYDRASTASGQINATRVNPLGVK